jgi:murein DD-endopeptidase MepM/ murein hydrolase activator NlpD
VEGKGQPGWQRTCSAEEFLGDLKEYNDLLESWPNVVGATVFQAGSIDPQWAAFDATPVWPRVISEYGEEKPMLPEEPSSGIVLRCPIWHNPPVTQEFGEHAVNYAPYPGHPGQDLGVPVGTVVRAAHDGKVHYGTGYGLAFGTYVWIKGEMEGITWWTMYNHLSRILADNKEIVRAGQIIALSGNSGTSTTGPHLDWRVETEVPSAGYQDYLDKRYYWHDVREFLQ